MSYVVCCVTYTLSSVSLLSEGSDRSGGSGGSRSSRGTSGSGVSSLSLQEDTRLGLWQTSRSKEHLSDCVLCCQIVVRLSP